MLGLVSEKLGLAVDCSAWQLCVLEKLTKSYFFSG